MSESEQPNVAQEDMEFADRQNTEIKGPFVMLCEGDSDYAFFRKLCHKREIADFDMPFINPVKDENGKEIKLWGKDSFPTMLKYLAPRLKSLPKNSVKGIILCMDCGNDDKKSFCSVAAQVSKAAVGGECLYHKPTSALTWVNAINPDLPPLVIVMVPSVGKSESESESKSKSKSGGLETLCVEALRAEDPQTAECLDQYLACLTKKGVGINGWGAETRSKAEMQCLIAVTNKDDPNKAGRYVFSPQKGGKPPVIDVTHPAFDALADDLKKAIKALS